MTGATGLPGSAAQPSLRAPRWMCSSACPVAGPTGSAKRQPPLVVRGDPPPAGHPLPSEDLAHGRAAAPWGAAALGDLRWNSGWLLSVWVALVPQPTVRSLAAKLPGGAAAAASAVPSATDDELQVRSSCAGGALSGQGLRTGSSVLHLQGSTGFTRAHGVRCRNPSSHELDTQ